MISTKIRFKKEKKILVEVMSFSGWSIKICLIFKKFEKANIRKG